ncbi:MAG: winged helix-turn-helix transcriptional regulator [Paracoccaceae bacterium]
MTDEATEAGPLAGLPGCPERRALDLVAERWTGLIVLTLGEGPHRYNALRRRLPGVSQRMLTRTLRRLEVEGMVSRHVEATIPPKVTYALTERGRSFRPLIDAIAAWGRAAFGTPR